MHIAGAITNYIDVAQLTLYAFWAFFAALIIYLILESKREGFPLVTNQPGVRLDGFLPMPSPKTFLLHDGTTRSVPYNETLEVLNARNTAGWDGAPIEPLGNPMLDGIGPASYTQRFDVPEKTYDGENRTIPLRLAPKHWIAEEDPDPRGMNVIALDGLVAGVVTDLWFDQAVAQPMYLEVALPDPAARHVLVPMQLARVRVAARGGTVKVLCVTAAQFLIAPVPASTDMITAREEDRIQAYFASGHLYAVPSRSEPLL